MPAIRVENLSKCFRVAARPAGYRLLREAVAGALLAPWRWLRGGRDGVDSRLLWALRDVSFAVEPGEVVGVVGANGAGKSTLFKVLSRITEPTSGRALLRGRVGSLLE